MTRATAKTLRAYLRIAACLFLTVIAMFTALVIVSMALTN